MEEGEGEVLDGTHKFGKARERKVQKMLANQTIEILPISGLGVKRHSVEEMDAIYTDVIQPVIDALEKAGHSDEARSVSQKCSEALLKAIERDAIQVFVAQLLKQIDPSVYRDMFGDSPEIS